MATKAQRATAALREAADAIEQIPDAARLRSVFGWFNNPENMRREAAHIEELLGSFAALTDDAETTARPTTTDERSFAVHDSRWNHPLCDLCFAAREPDRDPVRVKPPHRELCCGCGESTDSGIYVRAEPRELASCPAR